MVLKNYLNPKKLFILFLSILWATNVLVAQEVADTTQAQNNMGSMNAGAPDQAVLDIGKALFEGNCTQCHGLGDAVVIGPGLKGILKRRDEKWLIPWIKNSQAVIASGDKYAVDLYKKYSNTVMTSFDLKDDEIKAIIAYIAVESEKTPEKVATGTADAGSTGQPADPTGGGISSNYFTLLLVVLFLVLIMLFSVLILMQSLITKLLKQKEDLNEADAEIVQQQFDYFKIFQNRTFLSGVALIFVLVLCKAGIDGMVNIGMQQGYAPKQPIAFSHKLHAGQYQIDCGYCHTGVYKGRSATIPSANICMNCHNAIKRESPEIKKIYAALENDKPIEWIRVHNLPDLAYFNHAQHATVAGLACETCHGEIKEMEVVQQRAPLTMGWCINCHRQTVVEHAKGNEYYDRLMAAHAKNSKKPMKVEDIGGLECSKCHY